VSILSPQKKLPPLIVCGAPSRVVSWLKEQINDLPTDLGEPLRLDSKLPSHIKSPPTATSLRSGREENARDLKFTVPFINLMMYI
jgi:hypothetical protein